MKDFTTPDYINPIVKDILSNYTPDYKHNKTEKQKKGS
jgi:hypothetical protein